MSAFKGTPGPWGVWRDQVFAGPFKEIPGGIKGFRAQICEMDDLDLDEEEVEANARLIAAAPELLEACRGFVEEYGRRCGPADELVSADGQDPVVAAAMRAIAKATGEQP